MLYVLIGIVVFLMTSNSNLSNQVETLQQRIDELEEQDEEDDNDPCSDGCDRGCIHDQ